MVRVKYRDQVIFSSFGFFNDGVKVDNEEILHPLNYEDCLSHGCPECVKKYSLYTEADVDYEEVNNKIAKGKKLEGQFCGVYGCNNMNTYVLVLDLCECDLIKE